MNVKELVDYLRLELNKCKEKDESEAHLRILMDHYMGLNRAQIQLNGNQLVGDDKRKVIFEALEQLKLNRPLDYIIGESNFLGFPFVVNESVLIPRPETEELVMLICDKERDEALSILDIGTGSGCIPIGLQLERNYENVEACEISLDALKVASLNAEKLKAKVNFFHLDILKEVPNKKYDVVVSNPPYVLQEEIDGLEKQVNEYEPIIALTPGAEPLLFYKRMISIADKMLKPNGRFYWEIHEDLGKETLALFKAKPFLNIQLHQDMFGRDRFISANLKP